MFVLVLNVLVLLCVSFVLEFLEERVEAHAI